MKVQNKKNHRRDIFVFFRSEQPKKDQDFTLSKTKTKSNEHRYMYVLFFLSLVTSKSLYSCKLQGWPIVKMSRPTTRSKNKRHKQGDNVDISSELLRYGDFLLLCCLVIVVA